MPLDPEPTRPALTPPDLADYEARQAKLYAALAQYQHAAAGEALVPPGAFGLAVYHQVERYDGTLLRAVLVHSEGGSIDSGPAAINQTAGDLLPLSELLTAFVLGVRAPALSAPAQAQAVEPAPVQITEPAAPVPEPEPACPMPEPPAPAADPPEVLLAQLQAATLQQPPAPGVEPEQQPEPEEVEEVLSALDEINARTPDALKAILTAYKAAHPLGRTPFVKSLTTRARLATIRQLIAENQP
jgi:outer membrane biosynthesis protein TonB